MLPFVFKRLAQAVPVLLLVIAGAFAMVHSAPGGPFDQERAAPPEVLKHLNERYRLNDPLWKQFANYLFHLVQGDFGPSFRFPTRTVNDMIAAGFPATAELALYATLFALVFGLAAGIIASLKPNSLQDYIPMSSAMLGICLPAFVLGPVLLLIFGLWLRWLPVAGWGQIPGDKILPSITLGAGYAAYIARISRASMIEVLSQDYIRAARARGLSTLRIVFVHAFRGAVTPVISYLGPAIAGLLTGSFVVETIFQIPGLGRFFVQAALNRDYTMTLGLAILFAALILLCNLLSDLLIVRLNPGLRTK